MKKIILSLVLFLLANTSYAACSLASVAGAYSLNTVNTILGTARPQGDHRITDNGLQGLLSLGSAGTATFTEDFATPQSILSGTYTVNANCTVKLVLKGGFGLPLTTLASQTFALNLILNDYKVITAVDYPNKFTGNISVPNLAVPNLWFGTAINHGYNGLVVVERRLKK